MPNPNAPTQKYSLAVGSFAQHPVRLIAISGALIVPKPENTTIDIAIAILFP